MDLPSYSTTEATNSRGVHDKRNNETILSHDRQLSTEEETRNTELLNEDNKLPGYSNRLKGGGIGGGAGAFIGGVVGSVVPGPGTMVGILAGSAIGATIGATTNATTSSISGWGTSVKNMISWKKPEKETKKNL